MEPGVPLSCMGGYTTATGMDVDTMIAMMMVVMMLISL